MARVYELVTREEAAEKIPKDSNPPKQDTGYDSFAKKGLLDGEDW